MGNGLVQSLVYSVYIEKAQYTPLWCAGVSGEKGEVVVTAHTVSLSLQKLFMRWIKQVECLN